MNALETPQSTLEQSWINKLDIKSTSYLDLSQTNKVRFELMRYFYNLDQSDRTLYFLTLTYKPYGTTIYTPDMVNGFFTRFYLRHFLPHIHQTKNYNRNKYRSLQPITYAFLEDHQPKGMKDPSHPSITVLESRLHHHAICAVHPDTLARFEELEGENTLVNGFSYKVMTSDLKKCDVGAVAYATKQICKHPLELMFPNKR